jgi:DNA-binding NarL/FixJ family response regulator
MSTQVVTLAIERPGPAASSAHERLAERLGDARVDQPDPDSGVFDVSLEAESREEALERVWNALAAAGSDDEIVFLEHSDIPEHWRTRPA